MPGARSAPLMCENGYCDLMSDVMMPLPQALSGMQELGVMGWGRLGMEVLAMLKVLLEANAVVGVAVSIVEGVRRHY